MRAILIRIIRFYQLAISRWLPPRCRFHPNCSTYAVQALEQHGTLRGSVLAAQRICRCHPLNRGGFDPVPEA